MESEGSDVPDPPRGPQRASAFNKYGRDFFLPAENTRNRAEQNEITLGTTSRSLGIASLALVSSRLEQFITSMKTPIVDFATARNNYAANERQCLGLLSLMYHAAATVAAKGIGDFSHFRLAELRSELNFLGTALRIGHDRANQHLDMEFMRENMEELKNWLDAVQKGNWDAAQKEWLSQKKRFLQSHERQEPGSGQPQHEPHANMLQGNDEPQENEPQQDMTQQDWQPEYEQKDEQQHHEEFVQGLYRQQGWSPPPPPPPSPTTTPAWAGADQSRVEDGLDMDAPQRAAQLRDDREILRLVGKGAEHTSLDELEAEFDAMLEEDQDKDEDGAAGDEAEEEAEAE
ncbi:hypothetical protein GGR56DRAFT_674679 [Xylariaceae sp. FL0804]|nr:hypothetical protein GGR56DRAFT_674679 [Xylariaceae sp. FL0804]